MRYPFKLSIHAATADDLQARIRAAADKLKLPGSATSGEGHPPVTLTDAGAAGAISDSQRLQEIHAILVDNGVPAAAGLREGVTWLATEREGESLRAKEAEDLGIGLIDDLACEVREREQTAILLAQAHAKVGKIQDERATEVQLIAGLRSAARATAAMVDRLTRYIFTLNAQVELVDSGTGEDGLQDAPGLVLEARQLVGLPSLVGQSSSSPASASMGSKVPAQKPGAGAGEVSQQQQPTEEEAHGAEGDSRTAGADADGERPDAGDCERGARGRDGGSGSGADDALPGEHGRPGRNDADDGVLELAAGPDAGAGGDVDAAGPGPAASPAAAAVAPGEDIQLPAAARSADQENKTSSPPAAAAIEPGVSAAATPRDSEPQARAAGSNPASGSNLPDKVDATRELLVQGERLAATAQRIVDRAIAMVDEDIADFEVRPVLPGTEGKPLCPFCNGTGKDRDTGEPCKTCDQTGVAVYDAKLQHYRALRPGELLCTAGEATSFESGAAVKVPCFRAVVDANHCDAHDPNDPLKAKKARKKKSAPAPDGVLAADKSETSSDERKPDAPAEVAAPAAEAPIEVSPLEKQEQTSQVASEDKSLGQSTPAAENQKKVGPSAGLAPESMEEPAELRSSSGENAAPGSAGKPAPASAPLPDGMRWGHNMRGSGWHLWAGTVITDFTGPEPVQKAKCDEQIEGTIIYGKPVPDNTCMTCAALIGWTAPDEILQQSASETAAIVPGSRPKASKPIEARPCFCGAITKKHSWRGFTETKANESGQPVMHGWKKCVPLCREGDGRPAKENGYCGRHKARAAATTGTPAVAHA